MENNILESNFANVVIILSDTYKYNFILYKYFIFCYYKYYRTNFSEIFQYCIKNKYCIAR